MASDDARPVPAQTEVTAAASNALDSQVTDATPIERGVNAIYRLDLADGGRAVLKTPLYADEGSFLAEAALLDRLHAETPLPVPRVLARAAAEETALARPFYVMAHLDGRVVDAVTDLSPTARARLVETAADHLAAVHALPVETAYGHLQVRDGSLRPGDPHESWWPAFERLVADVTDGLRGEGPLSDDDPRFADLAPRVWRALAGRPAGVDAAPTPSFVLRDYRPANLVLAPEDCADPLVRGVLDPSCLVGDPLLDAAKTEAALVDLPLGGTDAAASLRSRFRDAYATARGCDRATLFDDRYPAYRLYARAYRMKALDYSLQFAREDDPDALAARCRRFVAARLRELEGGA